MITAIGCLLAATLSVFGQSTTFVEPPSPCPDVFKYVPPRADEKPGPGTEKWYGVINLNTDTTLHALFLNVILDKKADILGNWIGEVTTVDNLNFKIESTNMKLTPEAPLSVRFFIQYNSKNAIPKVHTILFNGKEICNADNPVISEHKTISKSHIYDLNKSSLINQDNNIKIAQSTTELSTKNIQDRYQTKSPYNQGTTKPTWTQKIEIQQATTESTRLGLAKSGNKAADSQQTKYDTQSISKINTQSKSQTSSQTESRNKQKTDNKITQNDKNELTFQLPISQTWSVKSQDTTEKDVQLVYSSTSNSNLPTWTDKRQDVIIDNTPKIVNGGEGQSQRWSQISVVPNNEKAGSNVDETRQSNLQKSTEIVQSKFPVWNPTNVENNQQTRLGNTQTRQQDTPVVIIANPNYYTESAGQTLQAKENQGPTNVRFEVIKPEVSLISTTSKMFDWSQEQPQIVSASTGSQYTGKNSDDNFDNRNLPSSNRVQLTTKRPYSVSQAPLIDDSVIDNPKSQNDEAYFSGGIPTLYIPSQKPEGVCGKVTKNPPSYLAPGSTTSEGQWPWQAALYQQQTVDFKYICGGTLVSNRHVITAAHCVARKNSKRRVNNNTLTVYLGKFNLRTSVEGVQIKFVKNIVIHPDYNPMIFSRDLAILELREPVSYTDWVRPACLWPENETSLRSIIGKKGSVVGWSSQLTGVSKEELNLIEMPVVGQDTCINPYSALYEKFTSDYTYCAGYSEGTSVCNSDSGGGMVFKKGTSWYLRGLSSISVARSSENRCDPTHYVLFTDIAKFLPWIEANID